ncbi:hypothetical protein [Pararobbsia alpina]|uniref:Uncharacterized protein n=1 Tax=Pararobbsia alpina TaxID=621374 RepID=A0A6S7B9C5_9BURK|nr:hypothetical protein [Pararobbsia alpina]CAB3783463.1 hypothetical protein LMG28138_01645 [Pararobbsia alpina]
MDKVTSVIGYRENKSIEALDARIAAMGVAVDRAKESSIACSIDMAAIYREQHARKYAKKRKQPRLKLVMRT